MTQPDWFAALDGTWPAAEYTQLGPLTLRRGQGGGSRVSATTAAPGRGLSIEPLGTISSTGRRQPSFIGIASSTSVRTTYSAAARVIDFGALKLSGSWSLVPVKSNTAERLAWSIRIAALTTAPLSIA